MSDDMGRACVVNEDFQAFALELHRRNQEPSNYTGIYCVDCDEEIPEGRRKALPGVRRCVGCQTLHEHWRAL